MINMLYLPFQLVEPTELTTPKGPNVKHARQETLNLKGNIITLKLPRHNPLNPGYDDPVNLKGVIDIDSAKIYLEEHSVGAWRKSVISHRSWRFNGPMFTVKLGDVNYSMVVYNCRYAHGESLFNPEQFEQELCNLLTNGSFVRQNGGMQKKKKNLPFYI
ncbi:hypothetical protein MNBD_GAMMA11-1016 [hydrothermal vent metagenome]|uniref:Uncharacterized protein n=1 Tax=hydrothermal vent metagenome TaxID=652676 RepID=A0A3B0XUW3_9ZZZZ